MKKLYEKRELTFAIVWIGIYCVLQSLANPLNEITHSFVMVVLIITYTLILIKTLPETDVKRGRGGC